MAEACVDPAFHREARQTEVLAWREQAWVGPASAEEAWEVVGLDEREEGVVQEVRQEDPEVPAWREQAWADPAFDEEAFQDVRQADRVDPGAWAAADLPFEEARPSEADRPDAAAYRPEDPV